VPLTPGYLVRDFARELELPLVIAAGPGLGTINHTLLTVEAARAVGLEVAGVVLDALARRGGAARALQPGDDRGARPGAGGAAGVDRSRASEGWPVPAVAGAVAPA
jgi:hypothetical protein